MKIKHFTFVAFTLLIISCKTNTGKNMEQGKLIVFGENYTKAWNSQKPENVASFFAEDGSLRVNNAPPLVGRAAITEFAKSFMTAFPDMKLTMDSLAIKPNETHYHWSFTGTFSGPEGNGNKVIFNGFEQWTFNDEGLVKTSIGSFDEDDYNKQLQDNETE